LPAWHGNRDRDDIRAHGRDERLRVEAFDPAVEFYYRSQKALTAD
jgi:acetylornithine deacetylase/succinyl-diaminopimelate desuccinylase-like protein